MIIKDYGDNELPKKTAEQIQADFQKLAIDEISLQSLSCSAGYSKMPDDGASFIEVLEHAEFAGNCYGTPRAYVEKLLDSGMNVVLEIDVQGALQVMKSMPDCVSVFILPPSFEELEHRLRGRGTETEEKIEARLETAKHELPYATQYDYQIVNGGDIDVAYQELRSVFLKHTGMA